VTARRRLSALVSLPCLLLLASDGSSQTIAFADKYAVKGSPSSTLSQTINLYTWVWDPYNGEIYGDRRATFADCGWGDVLPVTDPATATTRPSVPGKTFQVRSRPPPTTSCSPGTACSCRLGRPSKSASPGAVPEA
jgi:hypothetical protein